MTSKLKVNSLIARVTGVALKQPIENYLDEIAPRPIQNRLHWLGPINRQLASEARLQLVNPACNSSSTP